MHLCDTVLQAFENTCRGCRHSSRVVAFLQAVARPKFRGPRSASIAWSQVWLGLPAGRFQSGGTCRIHAAKARWWSSRGELWAIWPKSRRRLLVTRWESGEQPVVLLTSAFDTWRVYYTVSSRSCVVSMCQMDQGERAGTLWWPTSRTNTSKLAQCMSGPKLMKQVRWRYPRHTHCRTTQD